MGWHRIVALGIGMLCAGPCLAATFTVDNQSRSNLYIKFQALQPHPQNSIVAPSKSASYSDSHYFSVRVYADQAHLSSIVTVQWAPNLSGFKPNPLYCPPKRCSMTTHGYSDATLTIHD